LILGRLRKGERIDHYETVRVTKDGRRIDVSLTVSPVCDASGRVIGASKIARDITERRRAEREIARQREWFRVTLGSIGDAVITCDRDGRVTFLNQIAEKLTGWTDGEARGRALREVFHIVHERTREPVEDPCAKVLRSGTVVGLANHTALIARDGSEHPIADSGAPIKDDAGAVLGVVLVFRDVTEQRQAEEALAEQREWFETTLESIGDAVIATDVQGRIVFMNPIAERLSGWTLESARGRASDEVFRIVDEGSRKAVVSPVARALSDGVVAGFEGSTLLLSRDGDEHAIDDSVAPIRDRDGRVVGAVLVFRDVAERRRAERERAEAARERDRLLESERSARSDAERANRLKDEFVATLSHELRTPLNAIMGWTHVLRGDRGLQTEGQHALDVIERNVRMQAQLISDLLDMSRIISGKMRLEIEPVDLGKVIEQALETVRSAADAKQIRLRVALATLQPFLGDPARLQQVVWNLLSNAINFTHKGGHVDVTLRRVESSAEIRVTDDGIGIAPEFLPFLFDRFRQADASTTRSRGGLGLGLSIVRKLVELHGGTVTAESAGPGRGSSFAVRLPISLGVSASDAGEGDSGETDRARAHAAKLQGIEVLVVEDEPDTRELVQRVLRDVGARVTAAGTAAEALSAFRSERPDVIVSDIGLPEVDGYQLITELRALEERDTATRTPAIALTAYARSEDRTRALRSGYQAHLAKPIDPAELVATLASFSDLIAKRRAPEAD
jgi:PAS domain S-box-containing protein